MSIGSVYVDLLLGDAKFVAGMNRSRMAARSGVLAIQGDLGKLSSAFGAVLNPINSAAAAVKQLGFAVAGALTADKIVKYTDTWKQLSGRLSLVVSSASDLAVIQEQLVQAAQETRQPLASVIDFYSRLNQFIPEAVRGQYDLIGVTKSVTSALAITGETTISAQNAMIQFTQGIGTSYEASGAELRSLQELAPRLTQALQKALGDGEQSLQQLVKAGKITRQSVLDALMGIGPEGLKLAQELAKVPLTVAQAFTRLDNALLVYIGSSQEATEFTGALAKWVSELAENFDTLAKGVKVVVGLLSSLAAVKYAAAAIKALSVSLVGARVAFIYLTATTWSFQLALIMVAASVKSFGVALLAMATNPYVVGFVALASVVTVVATRTDAAAEATKKYNKILAETKTALTSYSKQTQESQTKAMSLADANLRAMESEINALETKVEAYKNIDLSSPLGLMSQWLKDISGSRDSFDNITQALDVIKAKYEYLIQMKKDALMPPGTKADKTTSLADIESATTTLKKYSFAVNGVTKEYQSYQEAVDEVNKAAAILKQSDEDRLKILAYLKQQYEENTPAVKEAKKRVEELKQIYDEFRPSILGITKEQDTYNQSLEKLNKLRAAGKGGGGISEDEYTKALKAQQDIRDGLADKEKENQSIYDKYEAYLTGVTEKQLEYNKARKELQGIVGKKTESGEIVTQTQADTALDKYRQHLEDSEKDTLEWNKMVSKMGKKAAENIQDAFAAFLYEPFKGGLDGMVNNFQNAIRKMASELLASQLFKLLKSEIFDIGGTTKIDTSGGKGQAASSGTSLLGDLGSWFAGLFADGGFISPGKWGVVGEEGAEIVYGGNTGASVIPQNKLQSSGGSTVLNMNIYAADADSFNRSRKQVAASGMQMLQMASQRNG